MTTADLRPSGLDLRFRPGSDYHLRLNGPAGWLASLDFTATLGGTSLTVTESGDSLIISVPAAVTSLHTVSGGGVPWILHLVGGNDVLIGTWEPSLRASTATTVTIDVSLGDPIDLNLGLVLSGAVDSVNGRTGNVVGLAEQSDLTAEVTRAEAAEALAIPLTQKAANNGVATLDSGGHIPTAQIPPGVGAVTSVNTRTGDVTGLAENADLVAETIRAETAEALLAPKANPTFTGGATAPLFAATGVTGAVTPIRFVGGTVGGPPTTGTFFLGDYVVDVVTATVWICTAGDGTTVGTWGKPAGVRTAAAVVGFDRGCDFNVNDYATHDLAVQAASDSLASTGGIVFCREGVYLHHAEVTFGFCVSLAGSGVSDNHVANGGTAVGKGTVFKWADGLGSAITGKFVLKMIGGHNSWGNFGIDGNKANNTAGGGIGIKTNRQWGHDVSIINCRSVSLDEDGSGPDGAIANRYHDIFIKGGASYGYNSHGGLTSDTMMVNVEIGACFNNMFLGGGGKYFTNCHFWGSTNTSGPHILTSAGAGLNRYNACHFENNATEVKMVTPAIFSACAFWENGTSSNLACRVSNANRVKFIGCTFYDNVGVALSFEGTSNGWIISSCDFYDDQAGLNPGSKTQTIGIHTQDTAGDGVISADTVCRDSDHATAGFNLTATGIQTRFGALREMETAVKTTAYTALDGELVRVDGGTSTAVTHPLPNAPIDGYKAGYKWAAGTTAPIVACAGSDVLNLAAGATSTAFDALNQIRWFRYRKPEGVWVVETSFSKGGLDTLYPPIGRQIATGTGLTGGGTLAADRTLAVDTTTIATRAYVDSSVTGLLDYRGTYDASGNAFPSSGGSGAAGAILKADFWIVSVAGTLGGTLVAPGDWVAAKVDTPGSTLGNWDLIEHDLGFTPLPTNNPVATGVATAPAIVASGLTGAVQASRYVGAVASVAPTTGTFAVGDFVIAQTGAIFICTSAGTPGTWAQSGASTFAPLPTALVSGRYYRVPNAGTSTSVTLGNGIVRCLRKFIPNTITLATIGAEITLVGDVGCHFRIGIWSDTNGRPNSLVLDAGQIDGHSATLQELSTSQVLTGGLWYWFGGAVQDVSSVQPTVRTAAGILEPHVVDCGTAAPASGLQPIAASYTGATGAFAGSFGTYVTQSAAPAIFIKLA